MESKASVNDKENAEQGFHGFHAQQAMKPNKRHIERIERKTAGVVNVQARQELLQQLKQEIPLIPELESRFKSLTSRKELFLLLGELHEAIFPTVSTVMIAGSGRFMTGGSILPTPAENYAARISYYSNPRICKKRYRSFTIKKKSGKERQIHAPVKEFKVYLRTVNVLLKELYQPHHAAVGFVAGRSIVDGARQHVGKRYVYNIDLKDFFHSFDIQRVKYGLMYGPLALGSEKEEVAYALASLCTHPFELDGETKRVLPQGSPVSPMITNILCHRMDRRLAGLAKRFGARYTRYADDITFSCDRNVFKHKEFQDELHRLIELEEKLRINPDKTRLQRLHGERQTVTGITVNEKPNVSRKYVKELRKWLYLWERYGQEKAQMHFLKDYKKDKGESISHGDRLESVLRGKLDFLAMVRGQHDPLVTALKKRATKLGVFQRKYRVIETVDLTSDKDEEIRIIPGEYNRYGQPRIDLEWDDKNESKGQLINTRDTPDIYLGKAAEEALGMTLAELEAEQFDNLETDSEDTEATSAREGIQGISPEEARELLGEDFDKEDLKEQSFSQSNLISRSAGSVRKPSDRRPHDLKYIDPSLTVEQMKKFNGGYTALKYTVHVIDSHGIRELNSEAGIEVDDYDFFRHLDLIDKAYSTLSSSGDLYLNFMGKVKAYLKGGAWGDGDKKRTIHWRSENLLEWAKNNPGVPPNPGALAGNPSGFDLPESFQPRVGNGVFTFSDLTKHFGNQFHIRYEFNNDNSLWKNIKEAIRASNIDLASECDISGVSKTHDFFTDVEHLRSAIMIILNVCHEKHDRNREDSTRPFVKMSSYEKGDDVYIEIHHTNNRSSRSADNLLRRRGNSMDKLIKKFNGLADLIMEGEFPLNDGTDNAEQVKIQLWPESNEKNPCDTTGVKFIIKLPL